MTENRNIEVTELDFDHIKESLLNHLKSQKDFSDYNYEGSAINVLIDILAYNTHLNAFMANMSANEMFLDSGSIRQSVVSKAKEIGYTPRSVRASKAIVDIILPGVSGNPLYITMAAGTAFDTDFEHQFATKQEYLLYPTAANPTTYKVENVELYDGEYIEFSYEVDESDEDQRFIIPSENVDTSTLRVFVKPHKNSFTVSEYFPNDDLNRLTKSSLVYFINETAEGYYEVTFGDGVLGKKVHNGEYITFSYIVADGKESANNIKKFTAIERIDGYAGYSIVVKEPSFGGAEKESIEEIKFLAPKMYQNQRRAVTTQDYETFLLHDYPWIDTINSWGGEYNDPPIYGKVFFSIKPKHTEVLSDRLKEEIKHRLISRYNVVTIVPEILDPDYIYVNVYSRVYYTKSRTILENSQLVERVTKTIYDYFRNTTEKFKMDFRFSPMTAKIDNTEKSIDSSLTDITMHKRVYPITNLQQTFELKFSNSIVPGTVESSYYNTASDNVVLDTMVRDNGKGKIRIIHVSTGNVINGDAGSVDYEKGTISMTVFPYSLPLDTLDIRVYCVPVDKNIRSGQNQIIVPDDSPLNVDVNRKQGVVVKMI